MEKRESRKTYKISIVTTARNDTYGGNPVERLRTMLDVLIFLTNKYKVPFECIIVEYNPPDNTPSLCEALPVTNNKFLDVRFIIVPHAFHNTLENAEKITLFEFLAKNIGVRRSRGEFIITTNQDIIFSDALVKFLATDRLSKKSFYRVNRHDSHPLSFDKKTSMSSTLSKLKQTTYAIWTANGKIPYGFSVKSLSVFLTNAIYRLYILYKTKSNIFSKQPHNRGKNVALHEAAAGDFLLMHKNIWQRVRGYDEVPLTYFIDGYMLHILWCFEYTQKVLPYPIYHMDHANAKIGRPSIDLSTYLKNCENMLKTGKPYKTNSSLWGAKNVRFKMRQPS